MKCKFVLIIILAATFTSCSNVDKPVDEFDANTSVEEEPYIVEKSTTEEDSSTEDIEEVENVENIELNTENITWLQESLRMQGHDIVVDGSFGPNTKEALKRFKFEKGLSEDSIYSFEVKKYLETVRENYEKQESTIENSNEEDIAEKQIDEVATENDAIEKPEGLALTEDSIYWLQESLKIAGHYTALDGQWGPNTKNALVEFKNMKGLSNVEIYDEETKHILEGIREDELINDPSSDMVLLNKTNYLSSHYVPNNLVEADLPKSKYMELPKHVAIKSKEMFDAASKAGHDLYFASGYRSYKYQETLFRRRVSNYGFEAAAKVVAVPGQSEHQTGLAIDITTSEMGYGLSQSFEETKAFDWLMNNSYKYGFILRYRKGKEDLTGYIYEPWHYRYIGDVKIAEEIMSNNLVLEEYLTN